MPDTQDLGPSTFGLYLQQRRKRLALTVRDAATRIGIDPTYLSKLEHDVVGSPSPAVLERIAHVYGESLENVARAAKRAGDVISERLRRDREVQALFRFAADNLTAEQVFKAVRSALTEMLRKTGKSEQEIEFAVNDELRRLEQEFRREVAPSAGLFAAFVAPRRLSRARIEREADRVLERAGLATSSYVPPTPLESILDSEFPHVDLIWHEDVESRRGQLRVLGLSRWGQSGRAEILINPALADDPSTTARARVAFTLGHELFHVIEHLPRIPSKETRRSLLRTQCQMELSDVAHRRLRSAEDWAEFQANAFAAAILMPAVSVRHEFVRRLGIDSIVDGFDARRTALEIATQELAGLTPLFELYRVSRTAMSFRLVELGLVSGSGA